MSTSKIYPSNFETKLGFSKIRQSLIDLCLSDLGKEKVEEMTFQHDYEMILEMVEEVDEFVKICKYQDEFPLNNFYNPVPCLKRLRIEGTFPDPTEAFNLKRSLETIQAILRFFKIHADNQLFPRLTNRSKQIQFFPPIIQNLNDIFNIHGEIKDNASSELQKIRGDIRTKSREVTKRAQVVLREAQKKGYLDDDATIAIRDGRPVIPVLATYKRQIKGIIHDESSTGKTAFIEPQEVVELSNQIRELHSAEHREIVKILTNFADKIRPFIPEILESYDFLAVIDFIRSKALYAIKVNGTLARLYNEPLIRWNEAAHPLLFLSHKSSGKQVISQEFDLNVEQRILVISGPNAGGKSVALQTVGLLQYMVQCGLLIPVREDSKIGIFEQIFIDIGDEQSIDNDLSTYSSHLLNMKFFTKNSNSKTLLLIDEFGTGTEPMLGGAIAEAVLTKLNSNKSFGVITTHYTNLKHFAAENEGIINGAMLYDAHLMQPMFKLQTGKPGSSFAFEIARKIGLAEDILADATQKLGEDHVNFDKHLKDILRDKRYWEKKRMNIRQDEKKVSELSERYELELMDLEKQRKEIILQAKKEASELLALANKNIENTIKQIKEANAEKGKTREVRSELENFKESVVDVSGNEDFIQRKIDQLKQREDRKKNREPKKVSNPIIKPQRDLIVGDTVKIEPQGSIGRIIKIKGKQAEVVTGSVKITLKMESLKLATSEEKIQQNRKRSSSHIAQTVTDIKLKIKPELDVRGKRTDDAIQQVSDWIDEAVVAELSELKILHGKGNGILRQMIREFLNSNQLVSRFHDEDVRFGGAGITVVYLDY